MIAADLATALAGATDIPHAGEDLAPGILQIAPVGFQPGEASYFIRVEHVALRYAVTIEAAPFSGRLLGSVVERLDQKPELGEEIAVDIAALGWEVRQTPRAGSPVLFDAREGNAILGTTEDTRHGRLTEVCIRLTRFMLGSLAVTQIPSHTRAAKQRVETTAQPVPSTLASRLISALQQPGRAGPIDRHPPAPRELADREARAGRHPTARSGRRRGVRSRLGGA